ncbi:unnamed protein product [Didymodactylos carnosus]|uniref:Dynein axonemal intermediate chain 4 n=1 Tax=Didymodactylos carnosus TaxID=1234261 RepID=A0A815GF30_9BILA|nr:unnamed protein product [Didymodactylos carnosus]CAF1337757.1 unnamed protein product [Didymodactylos carnosus]CAF3685303.1 unnamed protein product [Didymodactylos carnosus]CAF4196384.1 unnamed protein product [Didymodactylos carnosus]
MASALRSAAASNRMRQSDSRSVRTGASGGRSVGQTSGVVRKTTGTTRPARILPKVYENNQDVTPKRLIDPEPYFSKVKDSFLTHDNSTTPSETYSSAQPQIFSATKSLMGMSHGAGMNSDMDSIPSEQSDTIQDLAQSVIPYVGEKTFVSEDPRDQQPTLTMSETETIFILSMDSSIVANDAKDLEEIKESNERYAELCKSKQGTDLFTERGMNTFNNLMKNKDIQCDRISSQFMECFLRYCFIVEREIQAQDVDASLLDQPIPMDKSHGTRLSEQSIETGRKPVATKEQQIEQEKQFNASAIATSSFIMERVLNLNTNQVKQAIYRGLKPLVVKEEKILAYTGLTLDKLWQYSSDLTSDKNVSSMAWNRKNPDLLAVGYGPFEFNDQNQGLVCCWSLKNQEFPERYYHTTAGVTTVAFSNKYPSLLAVGLFDGTVNIYDVKNNDTNPLLDTGESAGKHNSPVWQLYWVEVEKGREDDSEVLMSISTDGRVTQWLIRKGFESTDYMKLKRILSKQTRREREVPKDAKQTKSDNILFRNAGGLCFDVCPDDKTIYLCGTEEGLVHRCSVSYNEQYLDTYSGHTGPVYKIAWSPLAKNVFLSSSADWTMCLWIVNRFEPCLTMISRKKPVFDICWSPISATMFCCVNEEAVEVWDLSKNTLEPVNVILATQQYMFTSITYAPNSESVLAGTNTGAVMVYHLKNLPPPSSAQELQRLIEQQTNIIPLDNNSTESNTETTQNPSKSRL